jgi:hypothetical protein
MGLSLTLSSTQPSTDAVAVAWTPCRRCLPKIFDRNCELVTTFEALCHNSRTFFYNNQGQRMFVKWKGHSGGSVCLSFGSAPSPSSSSSTTACAGCATAELRDLLRRHRMAPDSSHDNKIHSLQKFQSQHCEARDSSRQHSHPATIDVAYFTSICSSNAFDTSG